MGQQFGDVLQLGHDGRPEQRSSMPTVKVAEMADEPLDAGDILLADPGRCAGRRGVGGRVGPPQSFGGRNEGQAGGELGHVAAAEQQIAPGVLVPASTALASG
ncbi:hypothetical protein [Streptomyces sp. NEAU-174]|uniref:hypothetical protein n=1 Tax=Streptomyces sp. NEAU-174 TaxID=3458254 RepID=UPI0040442D8F